MLCLYQHKISTILIFSFFQLFNPLHFGQTWILLGLNQYSMKFFNRLRISYPEPELEKAYSACANSIIRKIHILVNLLVLIFNFFSIFKFIEADYPLVDIWIRIAISISFLLLFLIRTKFPLVFEFVSTGVILWFWIYVMFRFQKTYPSASGVMAIG